jgi:hypothetical protein
VQPRSRNPATDAPPCAANEETYTVKFQPAESYAPAPVEQTPNRQALLDLNTARAEAAAEVETLRARMNKLSQLKESVAALEIELSQTLAADGRQLAEWAMSDADAPAPQPDSTRRLAIEAKLADAVSQARAADAATASVESVLARANQRAAELERQVPAAVASVLLDEARSLLPTIAEAAAALAKAQTRFSALRDFLLSRAEAARDVAVRSGFFADLEALDRDTREVSLPPPMSDFNSSLEWRELAASLGDVPVRPSPAPVAVFEGMPELKW